MKAFRNTKEQLKRGLAVLLATAITAQMPMSYVQASEMEIAAEEQTEEISVTVTEELEEEENFETDVEIEEELSLPTENLSQDTEEIILEPAEDKKIENTAIQSKNESSYSAEDITNDMTQLKMNLGNAWYQNADGARVILEEQTDRADYSVIDRNTWEAENLQTVGIDIFYRLNKNGTERNVKAGDWFVVDFPEYFVNIHLTEEGQRCYAGSENTTIDGISCEIDNKEHLIKVYFNEIVHNDAMTDMHGIISLSFDIDKSLLPNSENEVCMLLQNDGDESNEFIFIMPEYLQSNISFDDMQEEKLGDIGEAELGSLYSVEESTGESNAAVEMLELKALPDMDDVQILNASEMIVEDGISALEMGEYFHIVAEDNGTVELSDEDVPLNSCDFTKYLKMNAGSSIEIKNYYETSDIWIYASADSGKATSLELIREDGSVVSNWILNSGSTIDLHIVSDVISEGETNFSLKINGGSARIYCVAVRGFFSVSLMSEPSYTPVQVGNGTIPVFIDMDYLSSDTGSSQPSICAVSIRKEGETVWNYFNELTDDDFLPYYALEANTTYEFCYALATMNNTPYVKGKLTTGADEVISYTIMGYNTTTKKCTGTQYQPVLESAQENRYQAYGIEGNVLYLGGYYKDSSVIGITLISGVPTDGIIHLYMDDGAMIPTGWCFTGSTYQYHFYLAGTNSLRYSVEGVGYKTATGVITSNGNAITYYTQDEEHEAENITKNGAAMTFELTVDSAPEQTTVNVTISNKVNDGVRINLYNGEDEEIFPVEGSGTNPAVFSVKVPDKNEDGTISVNQYRYEMSAEGYTTFIGYFGITSDKKLIPISNEEQNLDSTVNYDMNEEGYRIEVSLIPEVIIDVEEDDFTEIDYEALDQNAHIAVESDSYYRLSLADSVNQNHLNVESFETGDKLYIENTSGYDWEIVGYYCNTKKEDGTYDHDTTLRVVNQMNCDLYSVEYGQGNLTLKQLIGIEDKIKELYVNNSEWIELFGDDYSYYNYLVYWFRTKKSDKYGQITSLDELSLEDFSKIIYPGSDLDVWYDYDSGYRSVDMDSVELAEAIKDGRAYQSVTNNSDYAPLEVDSRLDEKIKEVAYTYNYSFAINAQFIKEINSFIEECESAEESEKTEEEKEKYKKYKQYASYIKEGNRYITYLQYENGIDLELLTGQLGTTILEAGEKLLLDDIRYRVEVNGIYSNVFQERDYSVDFGLYFVPLGKLKIQKIDAEDATPLAGVSFELCLIKEGNDDSKSEDAEDNNVTTETYTTDEEGIINVVGLHYGEYILRETTTLEGYLKSTKTYQISVTSNGEGIDIQVQEAEGANWEASSAYKDGVLTVENAKTQFAVDKVSNENPGVTLEGATLKLVKNDGTEVESWTTSAGEDGNTPRIFEGLAVGRYKLLEISAPKGYVTVTDELVFDLNADNTITVVGGFAEDQEEIVMVKNGVNTITMTDPYIRGKVELIKTVRDVPLPGAVFELYEGTAPSGTLIAEVTTGEDGKWESASDSAVLKNGHEALTQGLTEGSYYFKEKSVPDNVYLDTGKVYPFTVDAASHDKVQTISVANMPFKAALRLRKIDEQDQSPVSGASFKAVYSKTKEGLADSAEEISFASATDADGMAEITFTKKGFYKIVETVAEGYEADFAGIIEVTNDDYGKTLDLTEEAVLGRLMNPDGLEGMPDNIMAEGITNARKAGSVTIMKADGGDHALLRGVVFKLQKKNADGEYEDIASLEGVETGKIYTVSQDTDGLTSVSVKDAQNADGLLKVEGLAWGKYRLSEVTPLPGYTLNKDAAWEFEVKRTDLAHTYWTDTVKTDDGEKRLVLNRENHLTVIKKDAKTGAVLAGAEFEVLDLNKEPLTPAVTMTTGEDGAVTVGGKTSKLVGGKQYYLHKTKAPEGYELAEDVLFTMNTDGTVTWDGIKRENDTILVYDEPIEVTIVKADAADPKVRLEGAVFELKDSKGDIIPGAESLTTDHSGEVKIPKLVLVQGQSYTLTEIKAPEGYQIADVKPVISFCVEEDGRLSFTEDTVFEGTGGDIITVKNVKTGFCIDKISNEVAADGSEIRPEATLELVNVKTGSIVDTWTSGSIKVLEGLPAGEYKLTERVTPDGFVTAEAISFKLEENNRLTGVTTADQERITRNDDGYDTVTMVNEVIRGHVQIRKSLTNGIPLEGAVFSLYRQVGEMDVEGSTEAETDKDILIAQNLQTDERGIWTSVGNKEKRQDKTGQETLSSGLEKGIYYFKEMSVPEGVVLDSQSSWTFTIDEKDHGQVLTVDIENKTNIVNIKKVDKEQPEKVLAGVVFAVYEANTDGTFDLERPVVTATTDSGGEISVEGLLGGGKTYVLHELKALEGYELADDITFVMEKNGAVKINGEIIKDNLIVVEDMPKREEPPETEATSETEEPSEPEESSETEEPTEDLTGTEEQTESEKNSVQDRSTPSGTAASPVNTADETDGIVWIVWMLISFLSLSGVGIRKKSKGRK